MSPINLNRNRWPASRRDSAALRQQWNRLRHPLLGPHAPDPLVLHPSAPGRPQMDPLASRHPPLPLLRRSQRQGDRRPAPRPDPDFTKGSPAPAKASAGTPGSASHSASLPHSPSMPGCAPADPFTATGSGAGGTFVQGTPEALFQTHIAPMA